MRLIEFLQPQVPQETLLNYRRIPLWYLGGSNEDYKSYQTQRVFESMMLNEAAIDKYTPSIQVFQKIDETFAGTRHVFYDAAMKELQWAMSALQREDRIVWYMRFVKLDLLNKASQTQLPPDTENAQQVIDFITKQRSKHLGKMRKTFNDDHAATVAATEVLKREYKEFLAHAFSMNIPKINAMVFGPQDADEVFWTIREIEREWIKKAEADKQVVDHSKDEDSDQFEKVIEFDDGAAWFNLNRQSCSVEGDAMGHCGNQDGGSNLENETVLSLRFPAVGPEGGDPHTGNGVHWRPRLTFILDKSTGMLGEMKGRANTKPKEDTHPYIIKLLMHPMIKGIVGGGYRSDQNFELDDLEEDTKAEILKQKPELGTLRDMLEMSGGEITPQLVDRIQAQMNQEDVEYQSINEDEIVIENFMNLEDFIDHHSSELSTAHRVMQYLNGNDHFEVYGGDHTHNDLVDIAIDAFDRREKLWKKTQLYMQDEYPEEFDEDSDRDIDNVGDVVTVAQEQGEEWYDKLGWAIDEGRRVGSENDMADSFNSWANDNAFENDAVNLRNTNPTGPKLDWDGEIEMVMSTKSFVGDLIHGSYEVDDIASSGWELVYQSVNDLDEPHYGWDGWDEEAAIEYFADNAEIPTQPHHEIPDGGNATASHFKEFQAAVKEIANSDAVGGMIEKYKTVVSGLELINGAVVGNVYTWGKEFNNPDDAKSAFANTLKDLAVIASEHEIPFVVRGKNKEHMSDQVSALGYKKQDNGYLRFDPS